MSLTPPEIEAIVRLVVQRLHAATGNANAARPATEMSSAAGPGNIHLPPPPNPEGGTQAAATSTLEIREQVIAMRTIEGRLKGIQTLKVRPSAVVTPAVRDELRERKIQLEKTTASRASDSVGASANALMLLTDLPIAPSVPLQEIVQGSGNVQSDVCRLAAHINSGGKGALWWSKTPFAAVRATSSNRSLVAIQLQRTQDFVRALAEAEPNILVVDGITWNTSQVQELAQQWQARVQ